MLVTPFVLLGIVFATIGLFVVLMGVDSLRRNAIGDHRKMIALGLFLAVLGILLGVL
ncbi:hypothetical protein [Croceicoccus naphthovorans]|uniref:hypothetical protein n=1 Tax=Croceicoccus naphthovorans TaxID=1348774 RepID=UPI000B057CC7|nr:hypothetical protein [Croceicoccus naphthovorans]MBB3989578.1 uncharacterized membrane protein YozB (DUF420 family) [Croceicoccus naphthovorans]